jgi:hypothetical protein
MRHGARGVKLDDGIPCVARVSAKLGRAQLELFFLYLPSESLHRLPARHSVAHASIARFFCWRNV